MARPPSPERRLARSKDALTALSRLFDAARRREGLSALVLSDASGLPIAGAGPFSLCEEVAARCAVLASTPPANDLVPCRLDVVARTARVRRLSIDGIEVLLCAEGPDEAVGASLSDELDRAVVGCERIFREYGGRRAAAPPRLRGE